MVSGKTSMDKPNPNNGLEASMGKPRPAGW